MPESCQPFSAGYNTARTCLKSTIRDPQSAIPFGVRIAAVYIPQPHGLRWQASQFPSFRIFVNWGRTAPLLPLKPSPTPGFSRGVGIPSSRCGAIRFTTTCTLPARRCLVPNQFLQGMPAAAANISGGNPQSLLALPLLSCAHGHAIALRNLIKHFRTFMFYRAGHLQSIWRLLPQAARRQ